MLGDNEDTMVDSERQQEILAVRMGALGDILHSLPAALQLRRTLGRVRLHWLAESAYVPFLSAVRGVDRVWSINTRVWRPHPHRIVELVDLLRSLRRQRFTLALDFQGLLKSALLSRLSGARRVLGYRPERFKEKGIGWFYHESHPGESDLSRHVIEKNLELAARVTPLAPVDGRLTLEISDRDRDHVDHHLEELDQAPVLIHPAAGWVTKIWPASHYARLASWLRGRGLDPLFVYGPGEEPILKKVAAHLAPQPLVTFPTTILQLAYLCQRSRLLIGGDSGPLHLAVALGTPTVAILGPTCPTRNGPFNPRDRVVKRDLPCSNSYKRTCDRFICMDIPVAKVVSTVRQRLELETPLTVLPGS